jgi:hypothetical protein
MIPPNLVPEAHYSKLARQDLAELGNTGQRMVRLGELPPIIQDVEPTVHESGVRAWLRASLEGSPARTFQPRSSSRTTAEGSRLPGSREKCHCRQDNGAIARTLGRKRQVKMLGSRAQKEHLLNDGLEAIDRQECTAFLNAEPIEQRVITLRGRMAFSAAPEIPPQWLFGAERFPRERSWR